ncbi:hypothetical protein HID58_056147 [Brassica napus]|uniref:Uncharacterized protein n=1 Tax=Brassica napus TaxID=3708 RepID=A0ABQ8AML4_BRANA|nr:hypothetical protein HID58_056147 [Brassica napus]
MNSSLVMELILGSCTAQRPYWEHEFIPVERRWEVDDANLRQIVSSLKEPRDASLKFHSCFINTFGFKPFHHTERLNAKAEHGLPVLNNLLLPKTKDSLLNAFQLKDQLLSELYSRGHFPNEETEKEFNTMKCLINCSAVIVFTVDMNGTDSGQIGKLGHLAD